MIDLHLHTTVSDGRSTPLELVELARAAGLTVMAVTDHDTTGAVADVQAFARERGFEAITGIEITAVELTRDVHMLGYFMDVRHRGFQDFLKVQRGRRIARLEQIAARLGELGMPVDISAALSLARLQSNISMGRPQVARAMVAAGYVKDIREAFDRWLGSNCPAFVARVGPTPEDVIAIVHQAGGVVSLAHPGRTKIDERIEPLRDAGLDAIEVFHSDHDEALVDRYAVMAAGLGLLATGGTDFHGDPASPLRPGSVTLPAPEWEQLRAARTRYA